MIYQNSAWRNETGMTLDPLGRPLEPIVKVDKPTNEICPGCENYVDPEVDDDCVVYFDEYWHDACAKEDKRYHQAWDAEDKYRHEFDE